MSRSTAFCRLLCRSRTLSTNPGHSTHPLLSAPTPARPSFALQFTRNKRTKFREPAFSKADRVARMERKKAARLERPADYVKPPPPLHPLLEKLEKLHKDTAESQSQFRTNRSRTSRFGEPIDSDAVPEDDQEAIKQRSEMFDKKFIQLQKLLVNYTKAASFDDALKWMKKIDEFEEKHFSLRPEYRVIGALMNKLKVAEGKDKFLLQVKLNRALKLAEARDAFDPNDPSNYGILERRDASASAAGDRDEDSEQEDDETKEKEEFEGLEFDTLKQKDHAFMEKINAIDKKLEEKLAELDYTFGRKGKLLEEEIKELAEERNSLIEQKRQPLYRKGFDIKMIDMNRTCKVTKGGQVIKYSVIVACGNYKGVVGYAKAKAPTVPVALQKAREKCFQNLHYVERHEDHTVAHAILTTYKRTKLYLWPASTESGMKAGKTVQLILNLAGYKNVKSKVVGSRNPYNTVKAVFKALNAIETPKDVQEKLGRSVVDASLL